jgi:hypothetical protein
LLALAVFTWRIVFAPGVLITLENVGDVPLRDMIVYVSGREYSLGDLPAGHAISVRVVSGRDSGVELGFTNPLGEQKRLKTQGYVTTSYRGKMKYQINAERVISSEIDDLPALY